ncbi:MAG TPA: polysaccharide deacetylase family protein [Gemmatimonadales bacterium]|nr:polysaccharide deacetylase family protein [Gemmatimonadales bacterium]
MTGRLLMFWDYDTQWGTDADRARGLPGSAASGAREFECTDRLLELHARFGVTACFAVVGAAALPGERPYHDPGQIRRIHQAGHEVASHAFQHEWLPALRPAALDQTLRRSRTAIEECIGAPVTSFVPPYNQPFDYPAGLSFSRSERRQVRHGRIDVPALCRALDRNGYTFCRVAYRPVHLRLADRVRGRRVDGPVRVERIGGVTCCRLNSAGGFAADAVSLVERAAREGGIAVVYGHPHSLGAGNSQDERWLVPFLARVQALESAGRLRSVRPRELVQEDRAA